MTFTDTHCHIHEANYPDAEGAYNRALAAGVERLICVGTNESTSAEAVAFAQSHSQAWASVGLHPHDATNGLKAVKELEKYINLTLSAPGERSEMTRDGLEKVSKVVAIGECGLDYFYKNSPKDRQIQMLVAQLQLAQTYNLPVIFHVREAFSDFWPIFDAFKGLRGVLHSFTDNVSNLEQGLSRGLFIGVNGISTFAKDKQAIYSAIPLESLVLETDSPFLTPIPLRGSVNEPAFITHVAQHIANLRSISLEELSRATERNATNIFFKHQ